jgi:hypothetical protein
MLTSNKKNAASPKSANGGPENNYADIREGMREALAPISTNLILSFLGEHVLGLPRSF